ncbi:hypothetical protein Dda_8380 [Drechslerella dactyloides]|uniref:DUF202 domain-containing protein n=1 Tax=Drechslerella dactyloides TaxID=74499 RepID=A0AAD6IQ99_DREDA|nr:hypothetical protein Dda_8380 [Drechslerella dactyloides]
MFRYPPNHLPHDLHFRPSHSPRRDLQLSPEELVEIRASQRTFEGAYFRTSISLFTFSLVILKVFTVEFYPIGALFAAYGAIIMAISVFRRTESNRQFYIVENKETNELPETQRTGGKRVFRTSGNTVIVCAVTSILAYTTLLVLVLRLTVDTKPTSIPVENLSDTPL